MKIKALSGISFFSAVSLVYVLALVALAYIFSSSETGPVVATGQEVHLNLNNEQNVNLEVSGSTEGNTLTIQAESQRPFSVILADSVYRSDRKGEDTHRVTVDIEPPGVIHIESEGLVAATFLSSSGESVTAILQDSDENVTGVVIVIVASLVTLFVIVLFYNAFRPKPEQVEEWPWDEEEITKSLHSYTG